MKKEEVTIEDEINLLKLEESFKEKYNKKEEDWKYKNGKKR